MSDTPRTDDEAVIQLRLVPPFVSEIVPADIARSLERENIVMRAALADIHITAHCISKSGPATTPTLADAWGKFDRLAVKATNALWATRPNREVA